MRDIVPRNIGLGVTRLGSHLQEDRATSHGVSAGPEPEAMRKAAAPNGLPIDVITRVSMLDPYCYRQAAGGA